MDIWLCRGQGEEGKKMKRANVMMDNGLGLLLYPEIPAFRPEWAVENISTTFFKCIKWQVEETTDPINCPYHYFCDSTYPGNYPPIVDIAVFILAATSYLATLVITILEISGGRGICFSQSTRRYWLPSGPVVLPFILLVFAKGNRINTIFPISCMGPSILQLVYISALAFENAADRNVKHALFEASTVSGIMHASLYLDSIILPFYTGLEALVSSTLSGECVSCVCRKEVLVVGGRLLSYRGWSVTTFSVIGTLCSRIVCILSGEDRGRNALIKSLFESLGWILITMDCLYLMIHSPQRSLESRAAFGGVFVLICLHILRKVCTLCSFLIASWASKEGYV